MEYIYITVLDFESGKVYQYNLADVGDNYLFEDKDEPQVEEVEQLLIDQGHDLSDIQWMLHADPTLNQIEL
jgi:hypothetical protein